MQAFVLSVIRKIRRKNQAPRASASPFSGGTLLSPSIEVGLAIEPYAKTGNANPKQCQRNQNDFDQDAALSSPLVNAFQQQPESATGDCEYNGSDRPIDRPVLADDSSQQLIASAADCPQQKWHSYNHQRPLGSIGYIPPAEAETNLYRQQASQAIAA